MKKRLFLGILVIFFVVLLVPYKESLVFEQGNTGKLLAYYPIKKENEFEIRYTHSIHLSEVQEIYEITPNRTIIQTELFYEDYAIGMPSGPLDGETFEIENGKMHITNMSRVFPYLDIRIGQVVANHHLVIKEKSYKLGAYVIPGSWVRVKHRKINVLEVLKGMKIHEESRSSAYHG
jgi:hypothetical protein